MTEPFRPALFLDRDGVVNVDYGYVSRWERFHYIPGVEAVIQAANDLGWVVVIVTNQSGIARGYFSEADIAALHETLTQDLASRGARIDAIYACPYLPGCGSLLYDRDSEDRKPKPGMLLRAARDLNLDLARSHMIGDQARDMQAAAAAGVTGHFFPGGNLWDFAVAHIADFRSRDCPAARRHIPPRRLPETGSSAQVAQQRPDLSSLR
ncbi:D-glycero-alpha-D-manno-heptose-1,7-bisphosphate 7-phosphatase [Tianweitania populi]|uniref:D,D-heptose 1,7-bisphosphate phosphatase n=1 Tax=Tianweitania populi TaxID=1607949 RepID=A0A8J3GLI9_9HYPH|nr:HAD family hydrolase [Tianweitania populi]GHD21962.1 hypothetical protein GCM10016234_35840 [Tianweitania populi]